MDGRAGEPSDTAGLFDGGLDRPFGGIVGDDDNGNKLFNHVRIGHRVVFLVDGGVWEISCLLKRWVTSARIPVRSAALKRK